MYLSIRFSKPFFTLCGALAISAVAHSDNQMLTESDYLNDTPMISTASHFPQKRSNVPGSVTIITQDMIRASGALEMVDVLRLVPGMQNYYINGSRFGSGYHELGNLYPNRMEIKLDGHSVYDVFTNGAEWQSLGISLEDIEYIEVIRTSNASADGANAFQGTINIITRSPVGNSASYVRLEAGDQATRNASFVSNDALGNVDSRLTLRYRHNDGFDALPGDKGDDDNESSQLGWRGITAIDLNNTLEVQLQYSDSNLGLRDSNDSAFIPRNYKYNYEYVRWEHIVSTDYKQELLFYRNEIQLEESGLNNFSDFLIDDANVPEEQVPGFLYLLGINDAPFDTRNTGKGERNDIEWRHTHYLPKNFTLNWGTGARYDTIDNDYITGTNGNVDEEEQRGFINAEWALETGTVLNAGYILEHNTTIDYHHSERVGINQHLDEHNTLRLIGAHTTRAPSNAEFNRDAAVVVDDTFLWQEISVDKNIDPETINSMEFGYLGIFFQEKLQIDAKLFREIYHDLIDVREAGQPADAAIQNLVGIVDNEDIPTIQVIGNSSELRNDGIEIEIDYRPSSEWLFSGHYTWQNPEGYRLRADDDTPDINTRRVMNSELPGQIGGFLVMWSPVPEWEASLFYNYQSETAYFKGNNIDDQDRLDARIARNFNVGDKRLTIAFIGQNIADDNPNYEYFDSNAFDTRYYLSLNLEF